MAVATVFFFGMSVAVRGTVGIPVAQTMFVRAFIALVITAAQLALTGASPWGRRRDLLLGRGAFGTVALGCYFWSLQSLPLATATVLQGLAPLFTAILAVAIFRERLRPVQVLLFGMALAGVFLANEPSAGGPASAVAIAVLGAFCSACAYSCIVAMGPEEHPLVIILWFPAVTVSVVAPFLPWIWVWPTSFQWLALLAVGVLVQVAHIAMTRAFQIGPTSVVSLVSYLGVAWAGLGGWLIFGESPTLRSGLGLALVVGAVVATTRLRGR